MAKNQNNSNRGFASMDPEKQREIARKGGKSSRKNSQKSEVNQNNNES